jgi:hypothetical protein
MKKKSPHSPESVRDVAILHILGYELANLRIYEF